MQQAARAPNESFLMQCWSHCNTRSKGGRLRPCGLMPLRRPLKGQDPMWFIWCREWHKTSMRPRFLFRLDSVTRSSSMRRYSRHPTRLEQNACAGRKFIWSFQPMSLPAPKPLGYVGCGMGAHWMMPPCWPSYLPRDARRFNRGVCRPAVSFNRGVCRSARRLVR